MKYTHNGMAASMGSRGTPTFGDPTGWDSEALDWRARAPAKRRIWVGLLMVAVTVAVAFTLARYARVTLTPGAFAGGAVIKEMTFEGGLTDQATGADTINKGVTLERVAPLKGLYAARLSGGSAYLEQPFPDTGDLYASFYLRLADLPANGDVRLVRLSNGKTTVGNVLLSEGRLRLRMNSTPVGSDSAPLLAGQIYRIGIHQQAGNGSTAVLEGFLANGDEPFSAPFAATTDGAWTAGVDLIRIGTTTRVGMNAVIDNARLSVAGMPGPSD